MSKINEDPKILVTGATGLIGRALVTQLRKVYGPENVIASDLCQPKDYNQGPFATCDVTNFQQLDSVVAENKITWLFHLAATLGMVCEADPIQGMNVNMRGFENVMEIARIHGLRVFSASSHSAFGPSAPKRNTPDVTILRPLSLYGCTKVHNELIGEYYHHRFGVDFRCVRLPAVLASSDSDLVRRIIGFANKLVDDAAKNVDSICDVAENTCLSYVYIDDCIDGIIHLMQANNEKLTQRTYNIQGDSFTTGQLVAEIKKHVPTFKVDYCVNEIKQRVVDSTVDSVDDSNARKDWNWQPNYDLAAIVKRMIGLAQN